MKTKFIFVTGGVYSSLGKGITASSIGCLLKDYGFTVTHQKLDPYLNVDSRNISPYQHGENFVTDDGAVGDLDLGNYERFSRTNLTHFSTVTSGKIYSEVLAKERANLYGGKTIQVVPHITDTVAAKLYGIAKLTKADFVIVEIGGTIGDIESNPFIEAISRFALGYGREHVMFAHCCPLISIATVHGELKTKPTQHSVKNLRGMGINPDLLFLRSSVVVDADTIEKLAWSCAIPKEHIFVCNDVESVYYLPYYLNQQNVIQAIAKYFKIRAKLVQSGDWNNFLQQIKDANQHVFKLGLVSQFVELHDAYLSLIEALDLAGYANRAKIEIQYIQANDLTPENVNATLSGLDGIVLGHSETYTKLSGEILALQYCLENHLPILGIDSGFDAACSYVLAKHDLTFNPNYQDELRIGGSDSTLVPDSLLAAIYQTDKIHERHIGHNKLDAKKSACLSQDDIFEVSAHDAQTPTNIDGICVKPAFHPFACFVNYRPEYVSKPGNVDPLLVAFIQALIH